MEADLCRYYGVDLVDLYRRRLSWRKLAVLVRHLPPESATARAQGASGYSTLELVVMESGIAGPLNPRHPWTEAEREAERGKIRTLTERQAYYEEQRRLQQAADQDEGDDESA